MQDKPNVVYILADDMGYGDISAFNEFCPFETPNLDALCREGMAFCDAHATSAVCTPSRYGILTGRYNWRSALKEGVMSGYDRALIEPDRLTVAHMFRDNGYATAAIGKWHLGMDLSVTEEFELAADYEQCPGVDYAGVIRNGPTAYGFDSFYGIAGSLDMPPYLYIEDDHFTCLPDRQTHNDGEYTFWREGPTGADFVHEQVLPNLTQRVLDTISAHRNEPFFIYYAMPAPHTPILPSPEFVGKSGISPYCDFVLMCDDVVGKICAHLQSLGLAENTIVVFTSDNGCAPMAGIDQMIQRGHNPSYLFRGHKADIYEGGHRVPMIVRWPKHIAPGSRCDHIVCLSDFFATMAAYLHWDIPDCAAEDSVSNLPLWLDPNASPVRKDVVHQSFDGSLSIRCGRFKLEMCPGSGGWSYPQSGQETPDMPDLQLYDLQCDISERRNVAQEYPAIVTALRRTLADYVRRGRSTPGAPQCNQGAQIWRAVQWLAEEPWQSQDD